MNDRIRSTISPSSDFLSKIFVAPATSAPALILRTSVHVCTFKIFVEQRTIIRFLAHKGLRASAIAAKLQSVYETETLTLSTVKMWRKRFTRGRTLLYDDPRCGGSLPNNLAEAISFTLKERPRLLGKALCQYLRIAKGTCPRSSGCARHEKVPSSLGFICPEHEPEGRKSHFTTRNFFNITERSFCWFPECHHWR
jgi:hypothetical protein